MVGGLKVQVIVQYMGKMGTHKYHKFDGLMALLLSIYHDIVLCWKKNEGLFVDSRNLNC